MTKSSNACQSFRITAKALKLLRIILRFMYFQKSNLYLGGRAGGKFGLKKRNISFFSKGIRPNSPKMVERPLNTYLWTENSPQYQGKCENNAF